MLAFTAHKMEALVKLEARYGQLPGFSPAINDVLAYLKTVCSYMMYRCYTFIIASSSTASRFKQYEG